MPKDINTIIETLKDNPENMPFEIYQIYLDEETLYMACYPEDVQFFDENGNPQTYYAAALSRQSVNTKTDTVVDTTTVSIDNVSQEMSAYIAATEFVGRKIVIWKVFHEDLSSADNYVPIFAGYMDEPKISQYSMSVTVVSSLDTLDKQLPGRTFQTNCNWQFGSTECGVAVPTKTGIIESISSDHMTINDLDITEASDYWEYGSITIDNKTRVIKESGSGYVIVEYPFSANVVAGDSYDMEAGCDKSYDNGVNSCSGWDNTQYYGGFLSIPKIKDIREI
jgi:hypothetical protein